MGWGRKAYWIFSSSSYSGSETINKISIILPSGFTGISAVARSDTGNLGVTWESETNSYNFSIVAGSSAPNLATNAWSALTLRWGSLLFRLQLLHLKLMPLVRQLQAPTTQFCLLYV